MRRFLTYILLLAVSCVMAGSFDSTAEKATDLPGLPDLSAPEEICEIAPSLNMISPFAENGRVRPNVTGQSSTTRTARTGMPTVSADGKSPALSMGNPGAHGHGCMVGRPLSSVHSRLYVLRV